MRGIQNVKYLRCNFIVYEWTGIHIDILSGFQMDSQIGDRSKILIENDERHLNLSGLVFGYDEVAAYLKDDAKYDNNI